MPNVSRVEAGRQRAAAAKRAVALTAAGGFIVLLGVARYAHPGTAATNPSRSSSTGVSSDAQNGFLLGGGSISPSTPPSGSQSNGYQIQSSTS